MVKRRRKRNRLPRWTSFGAFTLSVPLKERVLAIIVSPNAKRWHAMAVETFMVDEQKKTMQGVLDNHGHQLLGAFDDVAGAIQASEVYARKWMAKRVKAGDCECEAIP